MTLPRRRAVVLLAAGVVGAFAVIPHLREHLAQFLGSGILVAIAVVMGTWLSPRVGLATPLIDSVLSRQPFGGRARSVVGIGIGLGVIAAVAAIAIDVVLFGPLLASAGMTPAVSAPPLWTGLLAALYGGLTEEIVVHYGVMSLFVWSLAKAVRGPNAYWAAIGASAVILGLGHLPAIAALVPLTPLIVARAILLNGLPSVVFGWLYWRRGLEAAMLSHGAAALILHVAVLGIGV